MESNIVCSGAERGIFMRGLPEMSMKHIFFENIVLKTMKGLELIEVNDIHLRNVQLLSHHTKPMIYVENANDIELNGCKFSANAELLVSVSGSKSGNIRFINMVVSNLESQVKFERGADASMLSTN